MPEMKVTVMVQDFPAARPEPQVLLVRWNPPYPCNVMPLMLNVVLPTLVSVVDWEAVWPGGTRKNKLAGLNSTWLVPCPHEFGIKMTSDATIKSPVPYSPSFRMMILLDRARKHGDGLFSRLAPELVEIAQAVKILAGLKLCLNEESDSMFCA
jgi:hypothetical protein